MVLRRPQLPRKEETHDVIGQVLVILRRPQLLRKKRLTTSCCDLGGLESARSGGPDPLRKRRKENHNVMLRSRRARRFIPFDKVKIGYAQGMLRVC